MANLLTTIRILCGISLLCCPPFSRGFYWLYLLGGLTDAVDGSVARRFGKATDFGAKYDTAADIVFVSAMMIKVIPAAVLPIGLWIWIAGIVLLKVLNVAVGFLKYHRFVPVHSVLNKVCGIVVFLLPLLIGSSFSKQAKTAGPAFACLFASVAAVDEFVRIQSGKHTQ